MVRKLEEGGIPAMLIPDEAIAYYIGKSRIVILGGYTIGIDGSVSAPVSRSRVKLYRFMLIISTVCTSQDQCNYCATNAKLSYTSLRL